MITLDRLQIDNVEYLIDKNSAKNKGFLGFFDWLRKDEQIITGIRTCFFDFQGYNTILEGFNYTKSTFDGKCIEILFTDEGYTPLLSGDQDFTNNYVYVSSQGEYLFTFGTDNLTEDELNGLLKKCELLSIKL